MIRQRAKSTQPTVASATVDRTERLRRGLLAGLVAIYVARPLLPSESPTIVAGDGLPFVMLTLLLAATWSLARLVQPGVAVRFGLVDWGWIVLLAWQAAGTYLATRSGYARAAINAFWEWAGLGIGFLLLRQLMHSGPEKRATCVVMIGLALTLSLDGIYQFAVEHPATREVYRTRPDQVLRELRIDAPPGSAARMLFEERLRSSEPTATFALANSLAGFLTPWLLMTLATGWLAGRMEMAAKVGRWGAGLAAALPMALCLVLTKSRAGYLAVLGGFAALLLAGWHTRRRRWQIAVGAAAVAAIMLAIGFVSGALDREVVTEALKSMSYRWHYWQGALGIIYEHPWFGCGPGNFQDEYTRFKLPQASEVVADPHNFAFEIWATCGTPALVALAATLLAAAVESRRVGANPTKENSQGDAAGPVSVAPLVGGLAGLVLAFAVGLFSSVDLPARVLLSGGAILPMVTAIFVPWIRHGKLPRGVPLVCAAALLLNLLAAGGIGFAGVAGSLWLLLAVGGGGDDRPRLAPRWTISCAAAASAGLVGMCYVTAYRPVLECRSSMGLAGRDPFEAKQHLLAATKADAWADEPWRELAAADFARWLADPRDESSDAWRQEQEEVLRRRPHSSSAWLEAADRDFAAYRQSAGGQLRREHLDQAVTHYRRAVELYPNYPLAHASLAIALAAADHADARREAIVALELHRETPHLDQKLPRELVRVVEQVARTAP
ncbi:MAG TPA: O-antigen ligase family protein [Pirellulales bacterium]|nr:O-antigen ligase family protein [Pirellulales bacterium]